MRQQILRDGITSLMSFKLYSQVGRIKPEIAFDVWLKYNKHYLDEVTWKPSEFIIQKEQYSMERIS